MLEGLYSAKVSKPEDAYRYFAKEGDGTMRFVLIQKSELNPPQKHLGYHGPHEACVLG